VIFIVTHSNFPDFHHDCDQIGAKEHPNEICAPSQVMHIINPSLTEYEAHTIIAMINTAT
jgi:hypothetical protein